MTALNTIVSQGLPVSKFDYCENFPPGARINLTEEVLVSAPGGWRNIGSCTLTIPIPVRWLFQLKR